jgi:hypothetical protein
VASTLAAVQSLKIGARKTPGASEGRGGEEGGEEEREREKGGGRGAAELT